MVDTQAWSPYICLLRPKTIALYKLLADDIETPLGHAGITVQETGDRHKVIVHIEPGGDATVSVGDVVVGVDGVPLRDMRAGDVDAHRSVHQGRRPEEAAGGHGPGGAGRGADARAQVNFGRHGMKWLALSIAKLTPID
jgi:hypothetical protein